MSTRGELLAAMKPVGDRTGDPNAWQAGLTPSEVAAAAGPATPPQRLDTIFSEIHPPAKGASDGSAAAPDREQGAAAEAIGRAETALAQQNSATAQLDMQVTSAILNAHLKTVEGGAALTKLQRETEAAVQTRTDLDTPAGARDFQRFLIAKLGDIRAIVMNASLDDTSKSALMAAWASLYGASKGGAPKGGSEGGSDGSADASAVGTAQRPADDPDTAWDPVLDPLAVDDPGPLPAPWPGQAAPAVPGIPALPSFGAGSVPGLGPVPGAMAGWGAPDGLPLRGLPPDATDPILPDLDDEDPDPAHQVSSAEPGDPDEPNGDDATDTASHPSDSPMSGPTPVTLPDGETVTAASPQLAAAIKAAVGGAPIAEAFRQQGMTIPAPGTAVTDPIDPLQLAPGDIGIFTDRHALALGPGKALLDGQIQHIATVSGPDFLGWEHPPASTTGATEPTEPATPTPTRPAATSTT
ncbi:MAG: DUF4226 domain-containing protein [Mycobacterium sp.]|nr:DUF4226 domain-containing protein [Mycobacterium sp.]